MNPQGVHNIAIDIDGVLADFVFGFTRYKMKMFPDKGFQIEHTDDAKNWDDYHAKSSEENKIVWKRIRERDESFWQDLPRLITDSTIHKINMLSQAHNVFYITYRDHKLASKYAENWLLSMGLDSVNVVTTRKKGPVCKDLDIRFAVDDNVHIACEIADTSPRTVSCLINRKYNQIPTNGHDMAPVGHHRVVRVDTLDQFLRMIL